MRSRGSKGEAHSLAHTHEAMQQWVRKGGVCQVTARVWRWMQRGVATTALLCVGHAAVMVAAAVSFAAAVHYQSHHHLPPSVQTHHAAVGVASDGVLVVVSMLRVVVDILRVGVLWRGR